MKALRESGDFSSKAITENQKGVWERNRGTSQSIERNRNRGKEETAGGVFLSRNRQDGTGDRKAFSGH